MATMPALVSLEFIHCIHCATHVNMGTLVFPSTIRELTLIACSVQGRLKFVLDQVPDLETLNIGTDHVTTLDLSCILKSRLRWVNVGEPTLESNYAAYSIATHLQSLEALVLPTQLISETAPSGLLWEARFAGRLIKIFFGHGEATLPFDEINAAGRLAIAEAMSADLDQTADNLVEDLASEDELEEEMEEANEDLYRFEKSNVMHRLGTLASNRKASTL
jgi:hypothetical protein